MSERNANELSNRAAGLDAGGLAGAIRGELIRPADEGYAAACALWNGMLARRPALIVRPIDADDVIEAVRFARAHRLPLSVRGGGHNVAGNALCDGGLAIDLSSMRAVRVDAEARTARAEGAPSWATSIGRPRRTDSRRRSAWCRAPVSRA